ncbi:uncharacterized protein LAESUDRAFT_730310 [Laetiporus sulphureus 93-53]|uniref:Mnn4-regulates the mannosylphosphorylation n=1 Tax=Laetiporus sulphureus 93-53 TaxID=1314785 RepID=A0A165C797_9APHY|nr:uncharacterized protein LAESUDRAFT_730310 [Laetiporus sulphureus 93-53]KZT02324.1 hypothetical protein LAESUDRAFT_730310 [Laetiporus sulphureus 93-53]
MFRLSPALHRSPLILRRQLSTTSRTPTLFQFRLNKQQPLPVFPRPMPCCAPSVILRGQILARGAASTVSGRPGSQTAAEAAQNIKEEVGNSTADLAKVIAGGNVFQDAVKPTQQTFLGITDAVARAVPRPYIVFGLAGGLPYLGATGATIYLARQAGIATTELVSSIDPGVAITMLDHALNIQTTYGAVLLSFLGALHWGFEFAGYGGHKGYSRLMLGAAPVVFGWSTLALMPMNALIAQWIGFTALWWADLRATNAGWTPAWYSQYRFYLSILVGTCIIGSLAATSYWGPVGGHGLVSHDLNMIRAEREQKQPEREGFVGGDVEALPAPENGDSYVVIKKKSNSTSG